MSMQPIDYKLAFFLIAMLGILSLWFFKRSWLEKQPAKSVVLRITISLGAVGLFGWLFSPRRLELLMLMLPVIQFYSYNATLTVFQRRYHRTPRLPSRSATCAADQFFNLLFLLIAV